MTKAELEQIQNACREWLRQPSTGQTSRLTIPRGVSLSRPVQLAIKALLTFDNVLITTAFDAETGARYTARIRRPGTPEEFIDTPFELIATVPPPPASEPPPPPLRATQRRYQEAMALLAEQQRGQSHEFDPTAGYRPWLDEGSSAAPEVLPRYLVYTGAVLLGYTLFERVHSTRERSGRFYPNEDYFAYADIFAAFPDAEDEYLEAVAKAAYGLSDNALTESGKTFHELSGQVDALALYLQTEDGQRMEVEELRLMDLSHKYDDQAERWLYITENAK